ncbi:MAG: hypothetical protein AB1603_04480 [Chloroflexota bacterium]
MKVRDLGVEELKALVQEAVEEKLEEMLGDPDQGHELQGKVKRRLERSLSAKVRGVPAEKVAGDVGLRW